MFYSVAYETWWEENIILKKTEKDSNFNYLSDKRTLMQKVTIEKTNSNDFFVTICIFVEAPLLFYTNQQKTNI